MAVRLDPADEYVHELGPEPNFNESMYINCIDPDQQVGGWFRIGNRANEGYAEMSVCLYLPPDAGQPVGEPSGGSPGKAERSVGFMYKRPTIDNNDAFDAGGLRWTMVTPFEELHVDYTGKVVLLDDPEQMADPKTAFTNNPYAECEVHLVFTGQGRPSMFGGEPDTPHETPSEEFAKGHYEQLVRGTGSIRVGDREWAIDGHGLRGFVWEQGAMHYCDDVTISTDTRGEESYHERVTGVLRSSRSGREWRFRGEVVDLIPLRNRRQDPDGNWLMTRISEGLTRWTVESGPYDGRVGYGLSEYLDQIIDGSPVGIAE